MNVKEKALLTKARLAYGSKNQIAVTVEELNELSAALMKFFRYDNTQKAVIETHNTVLEERADVEIVLNHIDAIYGFTPEELQSMISAKLRRLERWLEASNSMEQTTIDREVK